MTTTGIDLLEGEKILYRAEQHWIIIAPVAIFLIIALSLLSFDNIYIKYAGFAIFVPVALWRWGGLINFAYFIFRVTSKRVIARTIFPRFTSFAVPFSQLEKIEVIQRTKIERMVNCGDVVVTVAGGKKYRFLQLEKPFELKNKINEYIVR
jgi:uncharacterized protein YlzI (FlbEa/FlbD family)